MWTNKI